MLRSEDVYNWDRLPPDLKGMKASVLGMARSGMAAAQLLNESGCHVLVSDSADSASLKENAAVLENLGVDVELSGHSDRVLQSDFIVRSPGIPRDIPILYEARRRGILIVSELEVAFWFNRASVIAVTGSNGKTTTVEWLGDLFNRAGKKAFVCGNVGRSFSSIAAITAPDDIAVVEVSSFQLEDIVLFNPHIALITNFSPDHLDRYQSYEEYKRTKCRIFANQHADDLLIYNRNDDDLATYVTKVPGRKSSFGLDEPETPGIGLKDEDVIISDASRQINLLNRKNLSLPGRHNLENALAVAYAAWSLGIAKEIIVESLKIFPGVPHRLEKVVERDGVLWINDSKATNVASGKVALESMHRPVILLAGGRDKGGAFSDIIDTSADKIKQVIAFGEAGGTIESAWNGHLPVMRVDSLAEAITKADDIAESGDVVLLSPMCASFDEFENYEQRGDYFRNRVIE
ncbi:UDP-N-acetylmuramoyl-L-alanine--D-glutamate ligase [candidate division LCP-89 bacterium B3_LCP]|uniref:UDP-N-acetylmuramoylalanine--D-glutamate ligase n=1 Tax=candidate division LCP-89 bacterium B3_LCP TaxID=2012998 RepID=A0A532V3B2_UNCL8|nr:MAG: UDP-N-acetylmuramoyl-L-alanine--D-glutamate ligase [candidate division LCP-89 bacterium B3_LCP]